MHDLYTSKPTITSRAPDVTKEEEGELCRDLQNLRARGTAHHSHTHYMLVPNFWPAWNTRTLKIMMS